MVHVGAPVSLLLSWWGAVRVSHTGCRGQSVQLTSSHPLEGATDSYHPLRFLCPLLVARSVSRDLLVYNNHSMSAFVGIVSDCTGKARDESCNDLLVESTLSLASI